MRPFTAPAVAIALVTVGPAFAGEPHVPAGHAAAAHAEARHHDAKSDDGAVRDVLRKDVANAGTPGYKRSSVNFQDVFATTALGAAAATPLGAA